MAISKKGLRKRSKKKSKRKSTRKGRGKSKNKSRRKRKSTRKDGVIPSTQMNEIQGGRDKSDWKLLKEASEEYKRENKEEARARQAALDEETKKFNEAIERLLEESDERARAMERRWRNPNN